MILNIIKAERVGASLRIEVNPLTLSSLNASKASRRLRKSLHTTATQQGVPPIAMINNVSFPLRRKAGESFWTITVPNITNVQIIVGEQVHELGCI